MDSNLKETLRTLVSNIKSFISGAYVASSSLGAANGVAQLGSDGKVPSSQLPSYVDDVIEGYLYNGNFYEEAAHTHQITPEGGKIYVDLTDGKNETYRYSGSAYIKISSLVDFDQTPTQNSSNAVTSGGLYTKFAEYTPTTGLAAVATSGSYNDLLNKPTIPDAQIQSDWNQTTTTAKDFIKNKPTIPDAQIQSDWNQTTTTAKDYIKNKPSFTANSTEWDYIMGANA